MFLARRSGNGFSRKNSFAIWSAQSNRWIQLLLSRAGQTWSRLGGGVGVDSVASILSCSIFYKAFWGFRVSRPASFCIIRFHNLAFALFFFLSNIWSQDSVSFVRPSCFLRAFYFVCKTMQVLRARHFFHYVGNSKYCFYIIKPLL